MVDLCLGVTRSPAEIDAMHARGEAYDEWAEYFTSAADVADMWNRHEAFLTAEAARRGLELPARGVRV
jgi:hypothetical protein